MNAKSVAECGTCEPTLLGWFNSTAAAGIWNHGESGTFKRLWKDREFPGDTPVYGTVGDPVAAPTDELEAVIEAQRDGLNWHYRRLTELETAAHALLAAIGDGFYGPTHDAADALERLLDAHVDEETEGTQQ